MDIEVRQAKHEELEEVNRLREMVTAQKEQQLPEGSWLRKY